MKSICSIDTAIIISQLNKILTQEIKKENKEQKITNLHPTQAKALFLLNETDGLRLSDLANELSLTKPTVTVLVQKLEKNNYVHKKNCTTDKRCSRIYLTPQGKKILDIFLKVEEKINQKLFKNLSKEEIYTCINTLKKMINNY